MLEIKNKDIIKYEFCIDNHDGHACMLTLFLKRQTGFKDKIIEYASPKDKFIKIKYKHFIIQGNVIYLHTSFYTEGTDVLPVISLSLKNVKVFSE